MSAKSPEGTTHGAYLALALQVRCDAVNALPDTDAARRQMLGSLEKIDHHIAAARGFLGSDVRLVVLPEYFLTGYPMGDSFTAWGQKAALRPEGAEYEAMGKIAQKHRIHLSGNSYELDEHFPELYFQTSFLIDDSGDVVLRYRRLNSVFTPTPHDVWDRYLDLYGEDGVFPVAETALGRLAAIASEEILFPELARCLALRGAEVFLHSSSEIHGGGDTPKDIAKRARAQENLTYVVSANSAGLRGTPVPEASVDGGSRIVDYRGKVIVQAGVGESINAFAEIDLDALRRWRRRPGMMNLLSRQRQELYASSYASIPVHPVNTLAESSPSRDQLRLAQATAIRRLEEAGLI